MNLNTLLVIVVLAATTSAAYAQGGAPLQPTTPAPAPNPEAEKKAREAAEAAEKAKNEATKAKEKAEAAAEAAAGKEKSKKKVAKVIPFVDGKGTSVNKLTADAGKEMANRPHYTELADFSLPAEVEKKVYLVPGYIPARATCECPSGTIPWLTVPTDRINKRKLAGRPAVVVQVDDFDRPRAGACTATDAPLVDGKKEWGYMIGPNLQGAGILVCMPPNEKSAKQKDLDALNKKFGEMGLVVVDLSEQVKWLVGKVSEEDRKNEAQDQKLTAHDTTLISHEKRITAVENRYFVQPGINTGIMAYSKGLIYGAGGQLDFCARFHQYEPTCKVYVRLGGMVGGGHHFQMAEEKLGWAAEFTVNVNPQFLKRRLAFGFGAVGFGDHGWSSQSLKTPSGQTRERFEGYTRHAAIAGKAEIAVRVVKGFELFGQGFVGVGWDRTNGLSPTADYGAGGGLRYRFLTGF